MESTIGAVVGGAFRLVPEVLKVFDRKNERSHELLMLEAEMKFAGMRAEQEMRKIDAAMAAAELDAVTKAITEQGQTARAAGWFVAGISALVRPVVTYWFVAMYSAVKIVSMQMAVAAGAPWREVLVNSWTMDDMAMLTMTLSFWFLDRTISKGR